MSRRDQQENQQGPAQAGSSKRQRKKPTMFVAECASKLGNTDTFAGTDAPAEKFTPPVVLKSSVGFPKRKKAVEGKESMKRKLPLEKEANVFGPHSSGKAKDSAAPSLKGGKSGRRPAQQKQQKQQQQQKKRQVAKTAKNSRKPKQEKGKQGDDEHGFVVYSIAGKLHRTNMFPQATPVTFQPVQVVSQHKSLQVALDSARSFFSELIENNSKESSEDGFRWFTPEAWQVTHASIIELIGPDKHDPCDAAWVEVSSVQEFSKLQNYFHREEEEYMALQQEIARDSVLPTAMSDYLMDDLGWASVPGMFA